MLGISGRHDWLVFCGYMFFCTNHGILVTWTQNEAKGYGYNATAAVLHTETLKLIVAFLLAIRSLSISAVLQEISSNFKVLVLYFIPAFLYAVYNNLTFLNLTHFDPTSYYILMQLKIIASGVFYQVLFKKQLSIKQWLSLFTLMCGCMVKQIQSSSQAAAADIESNVDRPHKHDIYSHLTFLATAALNPAIILILAQVMCSTLAGVYTELLIKRHNPNLSLWVHNVFMYADSILCGILIFSTSGQPIDTLFLFSGNGASVAYRFKVAAVVCNMAAMGMATALFLKSLNSVVKNFATALEVVLTVLFSWLMFGTAVNLSTVIAMGIILFSIYVYSSNPLVASEVLVAPRKAKLSECDNER